MRDIDPLGGATPRAWHALLTKRHREMLVERGLSAAHLEVYLPRVKCWPPPAVGSDVVPMFSGTEVPCEVIECLLERYLEATQRVVVLLDLLKTGARVHLPASWVGGAT